jgi:uncharacterized protein (DUF433 family)
MGDQTTPYAYQTPQGGWRITGSRISIDAIVHDYWQGRTPEAIREDFPTLSLEQIYGAIAFYLGHREEIDRYLVEQEARWEQLRQESEVRNAALLKRLRDYRDQMAAKEASP